MKLKKYIFPAIAVVIFSLGMVSCFQDLGQDIPFNYPEQPKPTYKARFDGEKFYMPFDNNNVEQLTLNEAGVIGTPGFDAAGKKGQAYKGATNSYLSYPFQDFATASFSAAFWYKLNASPDRAGILTVSADDPAAAANAKNNRNFGFRFFREGSATNQTFKLNVGNGTADSWFDGGAAASLNPATTGAGWVFMAFTISSTECAVYINGQVVSKGSFTGVKWTGCNSISIASGAPYFTGWSHLSDNSLIDELRFFNKALTQAEVQNIMNNP